MACSWEAVRRLPCTVATPGAAATWPTAATAAMRWGAAWSCAGASPVTETTAGALPAAVVAVVTSAACAPLAASPRTCPVATAIMSCIVMVVVTPAAPTTAVCGRWARRVPWVRVATAVTGTLVRAKVGAAVTTPPAAVVAVVVTAVLTRMPPAVPRDLARATVVTPFCSCVPGCSCCGCPREASTAWVATCCWASRAAAAEPGAATCATPATGVAAAPPACACCRWASAATAAATWFFCFSRAMRSARCAASLTGLRGWS
uniref:Putative conserved secreted protein n=1 Tax=Ixodes ricinus TaxID=34613 RepID=A0A147BSD3_IXORI